jgi:hypothetical protein
MKEEIEYNPITGEELLVGCLMRGPVGEDHLCVPGAGCPGWEIVFVI